MTFREYVTRRDEMTTKGVEYKPGVQVPSAVFRKGGPEHLNPFRAQNPSLPTKPKPYMPIFRQGKGPKQASSQIINH